MLAHNRHAGDRSQVHQHYLKGSIFCGRCGARMAITHSTGRHGGIFSYFYCLGRNKKRSDCQQGYIPLSKVEDEVVKYYRSIEICGDELEQIRTAVQAHIEISRSLNTKEVERQERRLRKLTDERRKLLQAHYADAIPLDLLQEEQRRISSETIQVERVMKTCTAEFDEMDAALDQALALLNNIAMAYSLEADDGRRTFNQALFDKLFLVDEGIVGSDLAAPFHQLLDSNITERIESEQSGAGGFDQEQAMVAVDYERAAPTEDQDIASLLASINWHRSERPQGPLPVDRRNPSAYCRRRGSNLSLLAERGGFEPPGPAKAQWFSRPSHSSALPSLRLRG